MSKQWWGAFPSGQPWAAFGWGQSPPRFFESGEVRLRTDWQTLDDLVGTALGQLQDRLINHPVDIDLPDTLPAVLVDAPLVTQVFVNLLDNCVRHTPTGTHLGISAATEEQAVRVVVDDNGPGLPTGDSERLFKKFQRGDAARAGGLGLGLSIIRGFVVAQGGEVVAGENPGGGAVFTIYLPHTPHGAVPTE